MKQSQQFARSQLCQFYYFFDFEELERLTQPVLLSLNYDQNRFKAKK